jgi:hypothetical protein
MGPIHLPELPQRSYTPYDRQQARRARTRRPISSRRLAITAAASGFLGGLLGAAATTLLLLAR